ncbi:MAG: hypothetical protein ABL985_18820 [Casimicrobium sp.]
MRHARPSLKQRQEFHRPFWLALRRLAARQAYRLACALQPAPDAGGAGTDMNRG